MDEGKYLTDWCSLNNVRININTEVFFVNENTLIKPQFILNNKIYVIIKDINNMSDDKYYDYVAKTYGSVIIIPNNILPKLNTLTKLDISKHFDIKL